MAVELGERLKVADAGEMMRTMLGFMLHALVAAEATAVPSRVATPAAATLRRPRPP